MTDSVRYGERPFDNKYISTDVTNISHDDYISDDISKNNKATNLTKKEILIKSIGNFPFYVDNINKLFIIKQPIYDIENCTNLDNEHMELECPVCFNIFNDPLKLNCGHRFCNECINRIDNLLCPLCRTPFGKTNSITFSENKRVIDNSKIKKDNELEKYINHLIFRCNECNESHKNNDCKKKQVYVNVVIPK